MKLKTWSGSIVETRDHPWYVWFQWARGHVAHFLSRFIRRIPPRKELFFVLKFGGKVYLKMTETQLRAEVEAAGGVGVQFRDKSLVFQCYEIDPNNKEKSE